MFAELKPPRSAPRVMMHADNVGIGTYGYLAEFVCRTCGRTSDLMCCDTRGDVKRGMPCPDCNKKQEVPNGGS
jgi:hypothetical protein